MDDQSASPPGPARSPLLLRGFAPLVAAVLLAVMVVAFAPSKAPEKDVIRPGKPITTTTTSTPSTTSTTAVAEEAP